MDSVVLARALFGTSMAFHIIFATLGVGVPLMIVFAEIMSGITKNPDYSVMAKRWTKAQAILLGVAIPSGTIVGVMLSLLWPGFMEIVGQVISVPFQIEIWAFFLEALFMSIYIYAADRLSRKLRIFSVIMVSLGSAASAVLITNVHAWMNTPTGFKYVDGVVSDVNALKAVFNPSFGVTAFHVVASAFMTGAFCIGSIAAYKLLKRGQPERERIYHRKCLQLALFVGFTCSLATALNGHLTAQMLHNYLPLKLAAAEGLFETTDHAPLEIFGSTNVEEQRVVGGIQIPWVLSFLAADRFDTVVKGLNDFPRELWPPLYVHTLFNLMVVIGTGLLALSFFALFITFIRKRPLPKWMLALLMVGGPLSLIGIETGWIFSCTGRQPWVISGVQLTADAATRSQDIGILFALFIGLYVMLMAITILVMRFYFRRRPIGPELTPLEGR
ncbi:cytochrome d ubiquinol oxidase subunit I [Paenibacillus castaneae]|uniref:cytochrome ubiquinol oxidase subunit I n=1 Tax=Paenibacillus castaneae TaxID=474957 RepID=UPI000C9BBC31|nr:cytochrome ubiquinol oxidase subunit I [Paenibacillus castaneae]NIK77842.1 cytochrome d ubiquinol oxidase subunit I [Paenibacillus castaneae]